jgi:tRNA dimethylallyltransferase
MVSFYVVSKMEKPEAILLMGATATGKTDLAVKLAEKYPVEIISVDSALIYKDMDIGTAKPDAELLQRAPHFLIDILDPSQRWSAWDFVKSATNLISEITERGNIPLLVGGTMMYFNALEQGMNDLPMADENLRLQLQQQLQDEGLEALFNELKEIDPHTASRVKPTDPQRILRAIEVYRLSGKPMSELLQQSKTAPCIDFKRLILEVPERAELHQRIEQRFNLMLEQGFEQEVVELRKRDDLNLELPSIRCVGYRQMWMYLDGNYSYQEMVNKSVVATRQLAKRQLTWLRKYENVKRLDYQAYSFDDVCQYIGLK